MSRQAMAGHTLRQRLARGSLGLYVLVIGLFLLAPILAITAGSLTTTSYVVFPPEGLTLKWYLQIFDQPDFLTRWA